MASTTHKLRRVALAAISSLLASLPAAAWAKLLIVEIHYHPPGSDEEADALEFVEIYNDEPLPFDVSDYRLAGGIAFTIPRGTVVPARSVLAIGRDPERLREALGAEGALGPFFGRLDNAGEEVVLLDTGGSTVSRVRYNNRSRWPVAADGAGPTLVLRDPFLDPAEGESWGWSVAPGGTPGSVSFETAPSEVLLNEVHRGDGEAWVELFAPAGSGDPLDLSDYRLAARPEGTSAWTVPAGTTIARRGFLRVDAAGLPFPLDAEDQALFLFAPDGRRVVDAIRIGARPRAGSDGRHPDGGARWFRLDPPTPGAANRRAPAPPVAINEIHYRPYSEDEREEFVELINTGSAPVDLGGSAFTAGIRFVFPERTMLGPGELLVVAKDPPVVEALHGISGVLGPFEGVLADDGELLRLVDATGNPADEVRYHDNGTWPRWADGDGPSLELVDARGENSAGAAWLESDHGASSEWIEYEYTGTQRGGDSELHLFLMGAGEALVDDIEVVPAEGGANLIPDGSFDGENPLRFWRIEGTHIESRLEPGGGPDGSNALRIVASKRGDTTANRIERQTSPSLVAGRDYTVRFKARWLRGTDGLMTRSWNHGIARATRLAVPSGGGTPGRPNSRARPDAGPVVFDVRQDPPLPREGEAVTVTCRASDPDGVAAVTLLWRLDGAASFTEVPALDDGAGADRTAGDGRYAAVVESGAAARAVAEYYFAARDGAGNESTAPAEAPQVTFLYQHDDGLPAHELPAYRIVLRARDMRELDIRSPFSNHHLPGTLVVANQAMGRQEIHHLARIRYRGSPYLRRDSITGTRKGFRVNLPDEAPLRGAVRITLDEQAADNTIQVDRLVRHWLQKAGGVQYGERRHVHLIVRGTSFGTYEEVMTIDPRYLERAYGAGNDGGDLYKIDAHYEIDDAGEFGLPAFTTWRYTDNEELLRFIYKKRSREKEDDFSALMELLDLMDLTRTSDEELDARAAELIDLDQWVRAIAVYRVAEDWDAIGGWTGKNVYLYRHPDGRWRVIPWDHDVAMGSAMLLAEHNARAYLYTPHFAEVRRLLRRPAVDRKFNAEILRLLAEDYDRPVVDPVLDETYALLSRTSGAASPGRIKTYLSARRAFILTQIDDPPALTITTNGGAPFTTTESTATLGGEAPYRVESLIAEGSAAEDPPPVRWPDRRSWELDAALAPGVNAIAVVGYDRRGEVVATASIEVTYDAPLAPFVRGDSSADLAVNLTDAVVTLDYLFRGGAVPVCLDAADADDSGGVDLSDAVFTLDFLFRGGRAPPAPFPAAGLDPSPDSFECP